MHKFFIPAENFYDNQVLIKGDDVKHIYKVLRLSNGDRISVNNCNGKEYIGEIANINKECVTVNILEELQLNNESPVKVILYQGLPKSSKMDFIVQKSVEIGVTSIVPVITERVISKSDINEFKKTDRWTRIALEACKQCKRSIIPEVSSPVYFDDMLKRIESIDLIVVPYENEENFGIHKMLSEINKAGIKSIAVVIGPEGGFEEEEILKLKSVGAFIVTLGPRILRTETAGIVAASILMYELGDLGGINS